MIWAGVVGRSRARCARRRSRAIELEPDTDVPEHAHVNEQIGILIERLADASGSATRSRSSEPGATWCIPATTSRIQVRAGPERGRPRRAVRAGRARTGRATSGSPLELFREPASGQYASVKQVPGPRRLSQRISEGTGSRSSSASTTRTARAPPRSRARRRSRSARAIAGIREATTLPLLWIGRGRPSKPTPSSIRPDDEHDHGHLESVVDVRDEEELEHALEQLDPEIFLLTAADDRRRRRSARRGARAAARRPGRQARDRAGRRRDPRRGARPRARRHRRRARPRRRRRGLVGHQPVDV